MKDILQKIEEALAAPRDGRNSMGCSEKFYDPYYMVGSCFPKGDLEKMSLETLQNLIRLADFAGDCFY